jgi:uncharacterized protein YegP (UPF0339 family)
MAAEFEIKKSTDGQYVFNLKAGNGEVILTSETYKAKSSAEQGIAVVKKNATNDKQFERKTAKDGSPYFLLIAPNHEVIGKSEMYSSASAMEKGIASVKKNALKAGIVDVTAA